jgi:hypothetical protein
MSKDNKNAGQGTDDMVLPKPIVEIVVDGNTITKPGMKTVILDAESPQREGSPVLETYGMASVPVCTCDKVCTCESVCGTNKPSSSGSSGSRPSGTTTVPGGCTCNKVCTCNLIYR